MNADMVFNLIMGRLGKRTNAELRAMAVEEMNLVQKTLLEQGRVLPQFLLEEVEGTLALDRFTLIPAVFLREDDEHALRVVDEEGTEHELEKKGYDELQNWHGSETSADLPKNYAVVGAAYALFPVPTVPLVFKQVVYTAQPTITDSNGELENQWLIRAPDLLIAETLLIMASKYVQVEPQKLMEYQADAQKAWDRLNVDDVARQEANVNRRMG
jgi:hypothetical protein